METLIGRENYFIVDNPIIWETLSKEYNLDEDFIRQNADKVNWYWICLRQHLSINFIREFADKINWGNLALTTNWSDEFRGRVK